MSEDEEAWTEEIDEAEYCDYDVTEFCVFPQIKAMGLCTIGCIAYLKAVEREADQK